MGVGGWRVRRSLHHKPYDHLVSGYVIEKQEEGSNTWEKVPGLITDTSHTVKGLKEGKTYKFRVKAENLYGVSEPLEGNRVTAKNPFGQWIAQPAFFYFFFNF